MSSDNELKDIKLELSNLSKTVKSLSSQFEQMNNLLIQLLSTLEYSGDFAEEEAIDFMQNEKMLSRIKELKNDSSHTFQ